MGLIHLENMEFYAPIGHYEEEQIVGTNFLVNLTLETNMDKPAETDNLDDALDYQKVYEIVATIMAKKAKLLEFVANNILDELYTEFQGLLIHASVKISKLNPPFGGGKTAAVCIEMKR
jgi:dihydroneopterin aldolase